jgi:exodeoxyribonuclease V beta subunit
MTISDNFDLLNSPLEGTNLIEASAGTGKTYAIAGLFLRLLLEKNLPVNEILVVTFTVPATEELKDRIRTKLREAIEAFSGTRIEDAFLNDLVRRHKDSETALRSLGEALRAFDQAAIFTIHGFCRRMLYENAFESGSLFDTELITDQENLKREIVDDFWRTNFYNVSPLFVNYAIHKKFSPENLLSLLSNRDAQPYLKTIPQVESPDTAVQEKEFQEFFNKALSNWKSVKTEIEKILTSDEGLHRTQYKYTNIPIWIQGMEDTMARGGNNPVLFQGFEKFTSSELAGAMKKGHTPPDHPFFELCERLKEKQGELESLFNQRLMGLKAELFNYMQDELIRRKEEKNIQFFDDLLLKVYRALKEKDGEALARAMGKKFRAALIDEFQDTDPIQYAIFKKVFGTEKSILFLIGDPKQAIYGFRGADIFAYMDASRDVESRYTLGENWRSEPDLIAAINAIFTKADRPFVYDEIPFQAASPAKNKDSESLRIDERPDSPLQFWFLDASKVTETGKTIPKTQARELIPKAVAAEISRLISLSRNKRAFIGKMPLRQGDIAVLVRTHLEARQMQKALSALDIPSVLYTTENLFDSHEALEMERVLTGISEPNNESLLREALSTDMMGIRGEEMDDLMKDETGWEKWLIKFKLYHDLWDEHGFIQMFRYLLLKEKVLTRLMSLPDGERRNTNLLHLSEVLHQTSVERRLCMAGLLKWLSEQRDSNTPRLEEHQLRLESDENAVKLVTIHKSKGLEYPVVFCPFAWAGSRIKKNKDSFTFHDEAHNMRLTLDLGSPGIDENRGFAEKEELAENLRLLYVALTRARNRCYLVWGRFNEAETSAPAYLFHQKGSWEGKNILNVTEERFKGLRDEDVLAELKIIVDRANGTIRLSEMPMETGEKYSALPEKKITLSSRKFSGNIDRQWRISSFSFLVSGQPHSAELADRDAISLPYFYSQKDFEESLIEEEPSGIFSFPRGTKAGTFLHDIFEHLDFVEKDTSLIKKLVANKLIEYGFELIWQETICDMIQKVLSVPLEPERSDFTLSRIRSQDRINELGFYFPLKSISTKKLNDIFTKYAGSGLSADFPERIEQLDFIPARGFMKGFMDMVFQFQGRFYLVDWKSNFLGSRLEDYCQDVLAAAMRDEFYIIQYHIYTIALNKYLQLRLPGYNYETHFGGVYYIFLRGVDPDRGSEFGIYRERPSNKFIKELCTNLIEQTEMVKQ